MYGYIKNDPTAGIKLPRMAEISKNRYKFKHPTRENETLEISLIIFNVFYEE